MNDTHISGRYVVVGGGVAGVTCAREIARLHGDDSVVLVTKGNIVKNSEVVEAYSEYMEDVRVRLEKGREETFGDLKNVSCVDGVVVEMDVVEKRLLLDSGEVVLYDKVCICSGASPKRVLESDEVMTLRDTDSILSVGERLAKCGSLMVVGNGGIALDLVYVV
jgi:NADH dehydrogenase FAD-containing subunit